MGQIRFQKMLLWGIQAHEGQETVIQFLKKLTGQFCKIVFCFYWGLCFIVFLFLSAASLTCAWKVRAVKWLFCGWNWSLLDSSCSWHQEYLGSSYFISKRSGTIRWDGIPGHPISSEPTKPATPRLWASLSAQLLHSSGLYPPGCPCLGPSLSLCPATRPAQPSGEHWLLSLPTCPPYCLGNIGLPLPFSASMHISLSWRATSGEQQLRQGSLCTAWYKVGRRWIHTCLKIIVYI